MTNDYDKLHAMKACAPALQWIGDRTIKQAWSECERSDWMCWLLKRIAPGDPRLRLAAADMAERVWDLIPDEPARLASAWAIGAARRGDEDEMDAATHATYAAASDNATYAAASDNATYAAAVAADNAAATEAAAYAAYAASTASAAAAYAAYAASHAAYDATSAYAYAAAAYDTTGYAERAAQADILRGYFSAREIGKLFRRTPA